MRLRRHAVDAITATVVEDQFPEVGLEHADPGALFGRLYKTKSSTGLYKKKPYELRTIEGPKED